MVELATSVINGIVIKESGQVDRRAVVSFTEGGVRNFVSLDRIVTCGVEILDKGKRDAIRRAYSHRCITEIGGLSHLRELTRKGSGGSLPITLDFIGDGKTTTFHNRVQSYSYDNFLMGVNEVLRREDFYLFDASFKPIRLFKGPSLKGRLYVPMMGVARNPIVSIIPASSYS